MAGGLKSMVRASEGELVGTFGWERARAQAASLILLFRYRGHSRIKFGENVVRRTRQYYNLWRQVVAAACISTVS